MRQIELVSESHMVSHLLKYEIRSQRFGNAILGVLKDDGRARTIIDSPDLQNVAENDYRAKVLGDCRGYRRGWGLFTDFPEDVSSAGFG